MKLKLHHIISAFIQDKEGVPAITKTFNALPSFERRFSLLSVAAELNRFYEEYREQEQKIIRKILVDYCQGKINDKNEPLTPEEVKQIPQHLMPTYYSKMAELQQTEIDLSESLEFTKEELKAAELTMADLTNLRAFFNHNS